MKVLKKILLIIISLVAFLLIGTKVNAATTEVLKTNYYKVNTINKIIYRVEPETSVDEFKSRFYLKENEGLNVYKDSKKSTKVTSGNVGTSMVVEYTKVDGSKEEYTISVIGDFNGDGKASKEELTNIAKHIVELEKLAPNSALYQSADVTGDSIVDQRDLTVYVRKEVKKDWKFEEEKIDVYPPEVTITPGEKTKNTIKVNAKAEDKESGMDGQAVYTYYIRKRGETNWIKAYEGTNSTYEFTGLEENTEYEIKIVTKDKSNNEAEKIIEIKTKGDGNEGEENPNPQDPKDITKPNLKLSLSIGTKKITAVANASDNESGLSEEAGYKFSYRDVDSQSEFTFLKQTSANVLEITGLTEGRKYAIKVEVEDKAGNKASAIEEIFLIDDIAPTVELNLTDVTSNSVKATATATDVGGMPEEPVYIFSYKKKTESTYKIAQSTTANVCVITNLADDTEYDIKVEVADKAGNKGEITKSAKTEKAQIYEVYTIGEEVKVGNEYFYVIEESDDSKSEVTLISKYVLNDEGNEQTTSDGSTGVRFSSAYYWKNEYDSYNKWTEKNLDLNIINNTSGPKEGDAIYKARRYATTVGGKDGRLLTYEEVINFIAEMPSDQNNWSWKLKDQKYEPILIGRFFLGSAVAPSNSLHEGSVWLCANSSFIPSWLKINGKLEEYSAAGIRPVIKIEKNKVQKIEQVTYEAFSVGDITISDYGQYVDLGTNILDRSIKLEDNSNPLSDWRVFKKDNNGVWLILADYMPNSAFDVTTVGLVAATGDYATYGVKSTTNRGTLLNGLNSNDWKSLISANTSLYNNSNVVVKGAFELEEWIESWEDSGYVNINTAKRTGMSDGLDGYYVYKDGENETSKTMYLGDDAAGYGNTLYFPHKSKLSKCYGYFLASPSADSPTEAMRLEYEGFLEYYGYDGNLTGVRTAVFLPSDIELDTSSDVWTID